jgi:hypothetical protein
LLSIFPTLSGGIRDPGTANATDGEARKNKLKCAVIVSTKAIYNIHYDGVEADHPEVGLWIAGILVTASTLVGIADQIQPGVGADLLN